MQPDNNQPYSHDYLDSIAARPQVKTISPLILWGSIATLLVVAIAVVIGISSVGGNPKDSITRFGARLNNLKTISTEAQSTIKSGDLRTINSSLSLVLTNTILDVSKPLETMEIKTDDAKSKQVAAVTSETTELTQRLDDARLNAVFDRTYAREIAFYLKTLRAEMSEISSSTKNAELRAALSTADTNFDPLEKSFSEFNES